MFIAKLNWHLEKDHEKLRKSHKKLQAKCESQISSLVLYLEFLICSWKAEKAKDQGHPFIVKVAEL